MTRLFISCLIIFLIACGQKDDTPKDVLSQTKMQNVLWNVIQADQFYLEFIARDTVKNKDKNVRFELYEKAYKVNGISKETFKKSYEYYAEHPDQMKIILDSITARVGKESSTIYNPRTILKDTITPK